MAERCDGYSFGAAAPEFDGMTFCRKWMARRAYDVLQNYREVKRQKGELLTALEGAVRLCRCRGTGTYTPHCPRCSDSTDDHYCPDDRECANSACINARAAIATAHAFAGR